MPKIPKNFDYKDYFYNATPEEVYEEYKELVARYIKLVAANRQSLREYKYNADQIAYMKQFKDRTPGKFPGYYRMKAENKMLKNELKEATDELKRLYKRANLMERYVRQSGLNEVFVDLGALVTTEYSEETNNFGQADEVVWVPSKDFLRMADQLPLYNQEKSVAYQMKRLKNGRTMPTELRFGEEDGKIFVASHQGRHRNYGNLIANGPDAKMPVMLYTNYDKDLPAMREALNGNFENVRPEDRYNTDEETFKRVAHMKPLIDGASKKITDTSRMANSSKSRHMSRKKYGKRSRMYGNYASIPEGEEPGEGSMDFLDKSWFYMTLDEFFDFIKAEFLEEITMDNIISKAFYKYLDEN
jgi:hypothetical protein